MPAQSRRWCETGRACCRSASPRWRASSSAARWSAASIPRDARSRAAWRTTPPSRRARSSASLQARSSRSSATWTSPSSSIGITWCSSSWPGAALAPAAAQRDDAFARARDRFPVTAEVVAVERVVPSRHARRDRAPRTGAAAPLAGTADRVDPDLAGFAAHALVAHVLHARAAARHQHVADHTALHAERGAVDEKAKIAGRAGGKLDQSRLARVGRQRGVLVGGLQPGLVAALPVALLLDVAARGKRGRGKRGGENRQ